MVCVCSVCMCSPSLSHQPTPGSLLVGRTATVHASGPGFSGSVAQGACLEAPGHALCRQGALALHPWPAELTAVHPGWSFQRGVPVLRSSGTLGGGRGHYLGQHTLRVWLTRVGFSPKTFGGLRKACLARKRGVCVCVLGGPDVSAMPLLPSSSWRGRLGCAASALRATAQHWTYFWVNERRLGLVPSFSTWCDF